MNIKKIIKFIYSFNTLDSNEINILNKKLSPNELQNMIQEDYEKIDREIRYKQ